MSERVVGESFAYVPASEARFSSAQDIYQTAVRLRPLLSEIFKAGGLLDQSNFGVPDITDYDALENIQRVGGQSVPQLTAARMNTQIYSLAEIGYLRHCPNVAPGSEHQIATLAAATREIGLSICAQLALPAIPAVTFEPKYVPPEAGFLYGGVMETVEQNIIQPIALDDDQIQAALLWKLDPYAAQWKPIGSSARNWYQGDILVGLGDRYIAEASSTTIGVIHPTGATYQEQLFRRIVSLNES